MRTSLTYSSLTMTSSPHSPVERAPSKIGSGFEILGTVLLLRPELGAIALRRTVETRRGRGSRQGCGAARTRRPQSSIPTGLHILGFAIGGLKIAGTRISFVAWIDDQSSFPLPVSPMPNPMLSE